MSHPWLGSRRVRPACSTVAALSALAVLVAGARELVAQGGPGLETRWTGEAASAAVPLPEYPRPQLRRERWTNLNGRWELAVSDRTAKRPDSFPERILVPFPVESALSGVRRAVTPEERVWYRRTFQPPALGSGERLLLHFGAVDWEATVWVNGVELGTHRGGYDAFAFDVTDALRAGADQEVVVSVWDPTDEGEQPRGKQVLRPRSIWYTAVTGIWQTVWLEAVPSVWVRGLRIVPDLASERLVVTVDVGGAAPGRHVEVVVSAPGDAGAPARPVGTGTGVAGSPVAVPVPRPRLWSPDDPYLYDVVVRLEGGDEVRSYAGMRSISVERDAQGYPRLFLNGAPLFQLGLLDQGWWPDGLYTAPTDEALRHDIEVTRRMGFNAIRKHVKVEPARWYWHADRLGVLVWQDMPSAKNGTAEARAQFGRELEALVAAHVNHPSIVMWVPFNEGWGQHDARSWAERIRTLDPSRLVNHASGWTDEGGGDVSDVHRYPGPGMPDPEERRAAVLGEFGGLGLPLAGHTWVAEGNWGYRGYSDAPSLASAYRALLAQLHPLVGEGLAAAIYTQTTDVEIEVNGIMTYDREVVKLPADIARDHARLFTPPPAVRKLVPLDAATAAAFRAGVNTLAVHVTQSEGGQYLDVGIVRLEAPGRPPGS